jgi:hypothetical protein
VTWMIFDEFGNAFDSFDSRVAAHVALRNNEDCVLFRYDKSGLPMECLTADDLPPFTVEVTYATPGMSLAA